MRMSKRILVLLLSLLLCLSLVACKGDEPPAEDPPEQEGGGGSEGTPPTGPTVGVNGTFMGSNVTWKLMTDGELIVEGTGEMPDFAHASDGNDERPWAEWVTYIKKVTVKEGVTALGELAFKNFNVLQSVTLPASLTALPYAVFENCTSLRSVSGGVGLSLIDENAFSNCPMLQTVSVSTPLARVAFGAFNTGSSRVLSLHFTGSESEWQTTRAALAVEGGNTAFENATVTCFPKA